MSNQTAVAHRTEQRSLVESLKHPVMQKQIEDSLPPSVSLELFTSVTLAAINHNPDLVAADRQSFYNAVIRSAQEGLLPDGQDAVLNVYNTNVAPKGQPPRWIKKVQFLRMKGGVIKQFKKAGIDAYACCVYSKESFVLLNDDTGQHIRHSPIPFGDKGEMIGSYAVAPLPSGKCIVATMDIESIEKARKSSKAGDGENAPWQKWYDQMAEKSALHRLRRRVAIIDEAASKELGKLDDEFEEEEDEEESTSASQPPAQANDASAGARRPAALQSIVDDAGDYDDRIDRDNEDSHLAGETDTSEEDSPI